MNESTLCKRIDWPSTSTVMSPPASEKILFTDKRKKANGDKAKETKRALPRDTSFGEELKIAFVSKYCKQAR